MDAESCFLLPNARAFLDACSVAFGNWTLDQEMQWRLSYEHASVATLVSTNTKDSPSTSETRSQPALDTETSSHSLSTAPHEDASQASFSDILNSPDVMSLIYQFLPPSISRQVATRQKHAKEAFLWYRETLRKSVQQFAKFILSDPKWALDFVTSIVGSQKTRRLHQIHNSLLEDLKSDMIQDQSIKERNEEYKTIYSQVCEFVVNMLKSLKNPSEDVVQSLRQMAVDSSYHTCGSSRDGGYLRVCSCRDFDENPLFNTGDSFSMIQKIQLDLQIDMEQIIMVCANESNGLGECLTFDGSYLMSINFSDLPKMGVSICKSDDKTMSFVPYKLNVSHLYAVKLFARLEKEKQSQDDHEEDEEIADGRTPLPSMDQYALFLERGKVFEFTIAFVHGQTDNSPVMYENIVTSILNYFKRRWKKHCKLAPPKSAMSQSSKEKMQNYESLIFEQALEYEYICIHSIVRYSVTFGHVSREDPRLLEGKHIRFDEFDPSREWHREIVSDAISNYVKIGINAKDLIRMWKVYRFCEWNSYYLVKKILTSRQCLVMIRKQLQDDIQTRKDLLACVSQDQMEDNEVNRGLAKLIHILLSATKA
jgi:hypothetical protein